MKSIGVKIEVITAVIIYSLLMWIMVSGAISNPGSIQGFIFFYLSTFITGSLWRNLKEIIPHSKIKIILAMLVFIALGMMYALIWGYFDIQRVPFIEA